MNEFIKIFESIKYLLSNENTTHLTASVQIRLTKSEFESLSLLDKSGQKMMQVSEYKYILYLSNGDKEARINIELY